MTISWFKPISPWISASNSSTSKMMFELGRKWELSVLEDPTERDTRIWYQEKCGIEFGLIGAVFGLCIMVSHYAMGRIMLEGGFLSSYIAYIIQISNFTRVGKMDPLPNSARPDWPSHGEWCKEVGISHTYHMKLLPCSVWLLINTRRIKNK